MELASPSSEEELDAAGRVRLAVEQVRIWNSTRFFLSLFLSLSRRVLNGGEGRALSPFLFSLSERTPTQSIPTICPHRSRPILTDTSGFWNLLEACSGGCEKRRPQSRRHRLQCCLFLLLRPASSAPPGRAAAGRQGKSTRTSLLRRERSCGSACEGC